MGTYLILYFPLGQFKRQNEKDDDKTFCLCVFLLLLGSPSGESKGNQKAVGGEKS